MNATTKRLSRERGPLEAAFADPLRALGRAEAAARRFDSDGDVMAAVRALTEIQAALAALPAALNEAAAIAAPHRDAITALLTPSED